MTINILIKHLYIAVQYYYITNRLIFGDISRVIYKPTKTMKSNYFTQVIQKELISNNKLEGRSYLYLITFSFQREKDQYMASFGTLLSFCYVIFVIMLSIVGTSF